MHPTAPADLMQLAAETFPSDDINEELIRIGERKHSRSDCKPLVQDHPRRHTERLPVSKDKQSLNNWRKETDDGKNDCSDV